MSPDFKKNQNVILFKVQGFFAKLRKNLAPEQFKSLHQHAWLRYFWIVQQALYKKYFPNGGGSIFTFNIKGDARKAKDFIDNLQLFSLLANVADVKSLVIHPASTTHAEMNEEELKQVGIQQNSIRLSIGTEHIDDIIADLDQAFAAVK